MSIVEGGQILAAVADELRSHGPRDLGAVEHLPDALSTAQGRLAITCVMPPRDSCPATSVHAHLLARLGRGPYLPLEACIVAMSTGDIGAREVARNWLVLAGAPILSLLFAKTMLDADHFAGAEPWGVPGRHGFVGPAGVRAHNGAVDIDEVGTASFFDGAEQLVSDALPHIVKATVTSTDGRWARTLEIDGHGPTRVDDDWPLGLPPPSTFALCTRFAVFFKP